MTISRLDCGGEQIEHAPVDLVEVVAVTLDHMSLLAEEKQISLRFKAGAAIYVTGDSMRLKQIVVNLVDNAIRYTPDGGDVSVFVTAEQTNAILKVTDTGIGIPAASLPLVFNRFYRADQARSRESGGTGLGLSIVKAICDVHGGEAFVESIDGRGTTFRIELPLLSLTATQVDQLRAATFVEMSPHGPSEFLGAKKVASTRTS